MDRHFAWQDVEQFLEIARGLENSETFEELSHRLGLESPRMIKARLERLEKALGLTGNGLVERCKYEQEAHLTPEGVLLLKHAQRLADLRVEIQRSFSGDHLPDLRVATNLPTLMVLAPEVVKALGAKRAREGQGSHLGFRPDLLTINDYSEAIKRVADGGADIALFGRTPVDRAVMLPKNMDLEILLSSEISVFVPSDHDLIRKQIAGLRLKDLDHEHIIARPFFRFLFEEAEPTGGWTPVTDFGEVHTYIRSGIGVGLNTHFGFHMLSQVEGQVKVKKIEDILEIPFKNPKKIDICLLRSSEKKRWREIGPEAEEYLEALRTFFRRKRRELGQNGE